MTYIWTNHYLHGVSHRHDPLLDSTSVAVPPLVDRIHGYFSYHTEHHLFPAMPSRHYPAVSRLLAQNYPDIYERIGISEAWTRLMHQEPYGDAKRSTAPNT
jgi:fatty acid desaturase